MMMEARRFGGLQDELRVKPQAPMEGYKCEVLIRSNVGARVKHVVLT